MTAPVTPFHPTPVDLRGAAHLSTEALSRNMLNGAADVIDELRRDLAACREIIESAKVLIEHDPECGRLLNGGHCSCGTTAWFYSVSLLRKAMEGREGK